MEKRIVKLYAKNNTVPLKVVPGHFATNHSHVNYYIDMTTLKTRLSEAGSVAASLAGLYMTNTIVDTIVWTAPRSSVLCSPRNLHAPDISP